MTTAVTHGANTSIAEAFTNKSQGCRRYGGVAVKCKMQHRGCLQPKVELSTTTSSIGVRVLMFTIDFAVTHC